MDVLDVSGFRIDQNLVDLVLSKIPKHEQLLIYLNHLSSRCNNRPLMGVISSLIIPRLIISPLSLGASLPFNRKFVKESFMATQSKPKQYQSPIKGSNDERGRFVDRNLVKVDPKKEQFAPTAAEPVRQHQRMAGAC